MRAAGLEIIENRERKGPAETATISRQKTKTQIVRSIRAQKTDLSTCVEKKGDGPAVRGRRQEEVILRAAE